MPFSRLLPLKAAAVLAALILPLSTAAAEDLEGDIATLQWLDKVTARVSTLEAPVGESVRIGTLEILVRACRYRPPEEPPESAAFLDITETRPGCPGAGGVPWLDVRVQPGALGHGAPNL